MNYNGYEYPSAEEAEALKNRWADKFIAKADANPDTPFERIVFEAAGIEMILGITGLQHAVVRRKYSCEQMGFDYEYEN